MRIGLDVLGGDFAPKACIEGALMALALLDPQTELVLIGDNAQTESLLQELGSSHTFQMIHAPDVIGMDEHPAKAFTQKTNSSIVAGMVAAKKGEIDAFISAGNTGAMLVGAVLTLGVVEGLHRPTIGALYPCKGHYSFVCDVGANAECKPEMLLDFAVLGDMFMREVMGVQNPRVALINIGEEKSKGTPLVQQAYQLLEQSGLNFVGNAEGRDLNKHFADVYVTDGFTGNVLLKFGESFYDLMKEKISNDAEVEAFNYENIGGTPFLGVKGNILIGHGISSPLAFKQMILRAQEIVRSGICQKIAELPKKNS